MAPTGIWHDSQSWLRAEHFSQVGWNYWEVLYNKIKGNVTSLFVLAIVFVFPKWTLSFSINRSWPDFKGRHETQHGKTISVASVQTEAQLDYINASWDFVSKACENTFHLWGWKSWSVKPVLQNGYDLHSTRWRREENPSVEGEYEAK